MNELVERYIYDVTRRLPEKERIEVGRELEASITDMLPDNPSEQETIDVLIKLGEPRKLAEQYRQKPQFLISPAMYESYIAVLKTVVAIVAGVLACIGAVMAFTSESLYIIISQTIGMAVEGALQAAFWVTIGFVIAERCGYKQKLWTVSDLPRLQNQAGTRISRTSSVVGLILTGFFTVLFTMMIVRNEWLFIVVHDSEIINPLSQAALHRFIPYLIAFGVMGLVMHGLKLYWARWNLPLRVANVVNNIVWVSLAISILHWQDLMNEDFIEFVHDLNIFPNLTSSMIITFTAFLFIAIALIDIGASVLNTRKGIRKPG